MDVLLTAESWMSLLCLSLEPVSYVFITLYSFLYSGLMIGTECRSCRSSISGRSTWAQPLLSLSDRSLRQTKMMDMLKQTGRPEMVVGWYHSHPGFGCWLSSVDVNTQQVSMLSYSSVFAYVRTAVLTVL